MKRLIAQQISTNETMPRTQPNSTNRELDGRWSTTVELDCALTCLDGNASSSHLAVGGRNIFRIFDVSDVEMTEVANLRYGMSLSNLLYSVYDLGWSHLVDTLIASATPNGAVVLWDVNYIEQPGYWTYAQGHVFYQNKRTVHRVIFHPTDASILLSGSQDGSVRLFDVRTQEHRLNFIGSNDSSIRDIKFEPNSPYLFAAGADNGTVQIWDIRNPGKCENVLQAHNGPCFTLDWHPEERWLATGGRDRTVKIWDFSTALTTRVPSQYCAYTIASIARIHWRPHYKYQLVTSASIIEFGINVWDIRRPHLPTLFPGRHSDVVTGILWKKNDPNVLYTAGKDNRLCRILFSEGKKLALSSNPVAIDINTCGAIANAVSGRILNEMNCKTPSIGSSTLPSFFRKGPERVIDEGALLFVKSTLTEFTSAHELLSMDYFKEMATNYKLGGASLADLCDNNAHVAENLGKLDISQVWMLLKIIFAVEGFLAVDSFPDDGTTVSQVLPKGVVSAPKLMTMTSTKRNSFGKKGVSDDESDDLFPPDFSSNQVLTLIEGETGAEYFDSIFDDNDNYQNKRKWVLPHEGVQVIDPIEDQIGINIFNRFSHEPWSANNSAHEDSESSSNMGTRRVEMDEAIKQEILNIAPFRTTIQPLDYTKVVVDALHYYAEQNDVQTAVTIIVVLGDRIRSFFEPEVLEQWFTSYIDLLGHFELWSVAAEIIKFSNVFSILGMSHMSTAIRTACQQCSRPLTKGKWTCDRCKNAVHLCVVCHLPVRGLYIWCQGCSHGGHLNHVRDWFADHKDCPTGCGHLCEYQ